MEAETETEIRFGIGDRMLFSGIAADGLLEGVQNRLCVRVNCFGAEKIIPDIDFYGSASTSATIWQVEICLQLWGNLLKH